MMKKFSQIEEAVAAIAAGRVVIVVDSEDRENEGDFIAAAEKITPEMIHFMVSEGRGQLCMPVLPETVQRLALSPMVTKADPNMPRFTVPIDHCHCKTGISPQERAFTIRNIVCSSTRATDFVRPGHIFPLVAQNEGVLKRPGHTEATVDLARLAGLAPAGVLCEVCSRDGHHMADGDELQQLADEFDLPIITIDDLIDFRRRLSGSRIEAAVPLEELPTI